MNQELKAIGFETIADYFESELWKTIRETILTRDAHRCRNRFCGKYAQKIQHLSVSVNTLSGQNPTGLIAVCDKCYIEPRQMSVEGIESTCKPAFFKMIGEQSIGRSNPKIGNWFRNNIQMNKPIKAELTAKIESLGYVYA